MAKEAQARRFNHAYDFAFEVISNHPEGEDVTPAMLLAACRARLDLIEAEDGGREMLEACGLFDTHEMGEGEELATA